MFSQVTNGLNIYHIDNQSRSGARIIGKNGTVHLGKGILFFFAEILQTTVPLHQNEKRFYLAQTTSTGSFDTDKIRK